MKLFSSKIWAVFMAPLSLIYGSIVALRNLLYDIGWLRTYRVPVPVIAVGNLTVGGSGKTPLTLKLVHILQEKGLRVGIISRGYGRQTKGLVVVSDGKEILVDPRLSGDEPMMMAQMCREAVVVVCEDRAKAAEELVAQFGVQILVLDDAFQNRKLHRDLNIVVMHSREGLGNGSVLPGGPLREFKWGLSRADLVVLSYAKEGMSMPASFQWIDKMNKPVVGICHRPVGWMDQIGEIQPIDSLAGKRVIAFSGIAKPDRFFEDVRKLGCELLDVKKFKDHHDFKKKEIESIWQQAESLRAEAVVMTQKDQIKILKDTAFTIPHFALAIELVIVSNLDKFEEQVNAILDTEGGPFDN